MTGTPHTAFNSVGGCSLGVEITFAHVTEACLKPFIKQAMHCGMVKDTDA
jgi:hypothetical protein